MDTDIDTQTHSKYTNHHERSLTHEAVELVVADEVGAVRDAGVAAGTLVVLVDTLTDTLLTVPVTTRGQGRVPHLTRHTHGATEVVVQCCHLQGYVIMITSIFTLPYLQTSHS